MADVDLDAVEARRLHAAAFNSLTELLRAQDDDTLSYYERIDYADDDGDRFDELVAHNVYLHVEAQGPAQWWMRIVDGDTDTDTEITINLGAVNVRAKGYARVEIAEGLTGMVTT